MRAYRDGDRARLAGALRQICPRWRLFVATTALLIAKTITIGADLAGMADAGQMLTRINSQLLTVLFGTGIATAICRFSYGQIASILKWVTLALCAHVITPFMLKPQVRLKPVWANAPPSQAPGQLAL